MRVVYFIDLILQFSGINTIESFFAADASIERMSMVADCYFLENSQKAIDIFEK